MDSNPSNTRDLYLYCHPSFNAFFIYDKNAVEWIVSSYESNYDSKEIETGNLKTWLSRNTAIFNTRFENVIVAVDTHLQVLVPQSFDEEQKSASIRGFLKDADDSEKITLSQELGNEAMIYQFDKEIHDILNSHFENIHYIHGDTGLIHFSDNNENIVVAQIFDKNLSIAYSNHGKLQYYNRFECKHTNDFLYYTLLAYKSIGLDPHIVPLLMGGLIESDSPLYAEIRNYIENINIAEPNSAGRFDFSKHYFFNILNLPL